MLIKFKLQEVVLMEINTVATGQLRDTATLTQDT